MLLGTIWGIRLGVHPLFFLVLAASAAWGQLAEAVLVFLAVLLHEAAHAATARGRGLVVHEIELLPFGGVARLGGPLELDPGAEVRVALAGPAASGGLALAILAARPLLPAGWSWPDLFLTANAALALFNLVPALPLDGGRVLRAVWVRRLGLRRATERAARLSQGLALALAAASLAGVVAGRIHPLAPAVALFVYFAARREREEGMYVLLRYLARKKRELGERGCLAVQPLVASEKTPLSRVVRQFVPLRYHLIWVLGDDGKVLGMATEVEVLDGLFRRGLDLAVGDLVHRGPAG